MANDYFDNFTRLEKGTKARAESVNSLFDQVETGLDKLPSENALNRGTHNYAVDTGVADAYVVSLSHVSTSYQDGQEVVFLTARANTGASTLDVSGIGPVAITLSDGSALPVGVITAKSLVKIQWNTTRNNWQLHGVFDITNSVSAFVATLLPAATASAFMDTLGITTFAQTLLDDANASDFLTTLLLRSTSNGEGASFIGVEDAAGNFTSTKNVEAILAEIGIPVPSGTKMVFYQAAAPAGWTQTLDNVADSALRVVNDGTGTATGGGTGGTHGLTASPATEHTHQIYSAISTSSSQFFNSAGVATAISAGGSIVSASHILVGTATSADYSRLIDDLYSSSVGATKFDPKYIDMIICSKD